MRIIFYLLSVLGGAFSLYALLCTVRVFLTWIPALNTSPFGTLLSQICDPWLNLFRRLRFLRSTRLDFSPVVAIGVLAMLSSLLKYTAHTRHFSLIAVVFIVLRMLFSVISSLLMFFNVLLAVRLTAELLHRTNSPVWYTIDQVLNPVVYKVSRFFLGKRFVQPKTALLITLVCSIALYALLGYAVSRFL